MKSVILFFVVFIFLITSSVQALSWAYSFVVWDGNVYEVKEDNIPESEIGNKIGEVKTKPNDMTGNYYGDASNAYPKGTEYFEINRISTEIAIAVEVEENKWQKAVYAHEAPFRLIDLFTKILPFLIVIPMAIVIIFQFKKRRKK